MTKIKILPSLLLAATLPFSASATTENSSDTTFTTIETSEEHFAKAQYYRWFQLYERPMNDIRIANQLQILTNDVYISSTSGSMQGKENYPERVKKFKGWTNAHHIQNIDVKKFINGSLQLTATVGYQNIMPDGTKNSYKLSYKTQLTGDSLPKFSRIEITPIGKSEIAFVDAYPTNRMRSLMHAWLGKMETQNGTIAPFKELLTDDYQLNFSSQNNIHSDKEFTQWLQGTASQVASSHHYVNNFKTKTISPNTYEVQVEFDWHGVLKNGKKMEAKTRHKWIVIDNPNEAFARIKKMDVTAIEPFKIVE